jgi:biotin synthase-like enzyme
MSATSELNTVRHDWQLSEVEALLALPFNDLLFNAQTVHRANFDPNEIQVSSLLKPVLVQKIVVIAHKALVTIPI